jgi:hypothetical protein
MKITSQSLAFLSLMVSSQLSSAVVIQPPSGDCWISTLDILKAEIVSMIVLVVQKFLH